MKEFKAWLILILFILLLRVIYLLLEGGISYEYPLDISSGGYFYLTLKLAH